jgi:hypothetical protein
VYHPLPPPLTITILEVIPTLKPPEWPLCRLANADEQVKKRESTPANPDPTLTTLTSPTSHKLHILRSDTHQPSSPAQLNTLSPSTRASNPSSPKTNLTLTPPRAYPRASTPSKLLYVAYYRNRFLERLLRGSLYCFFWRRMKRDSHRRGDFLRRRWYSGKLLRY